MNASDDSLGLRAYARHRGVAASRVHRLWSDGVLPRNDDGTFPVRRCDAILAERAEAVSPAVRAANEAAKRRRRGAQVPAASGPAAGGGGVPSSTVAPDTPSTTQIRELARARRENANAEQAERENAKHRGDLLDREGVLRAIEHFAAVIRTRAETIPSRLSTALIVAFPGVEQRKAIGVIEDEVNRYLADCCEQLAGLQAAIPARKD